MALTFAAAESISPKIGSLFQDHLAGRVVARTATAAAHLPGLRDAGDDDLYSRFDVTDALGAGNSVTASLIAPRKFSKSPELFWGPFLQLGTYLGVENEAARFLVDAVFDPLNLVLPGSNFLLNRVGRAAELMTAATRGGQLGKSAASAVSSVEKTLHAAAAIANNPGLKTEILEAAKSGKKLPKQLLNNLLDLPLGEADAAVIKAMRKHRGALAEVMRWEKAWGDKHLGAPAFLQPTVASRVAVGQVNPLFRVEKPFAMSRQLLGFKYRNNELLAPVTRAIGGGFGRGLDAFRGKAIQSAEQQLLPELTQKSLGAFEGIAAGTAGTALHDLQDMMDFVGVVNEDASQQVVHMLGLTEELGGEQGMKAAYAAFKRRKRDVSFGQFQEIVLNDALLRREAQIDELSRQREVRFNDFLDRVQRRAGDQGLDAGNALDRINAFRAARHSFGLEQMVQDANGLANAIAAREAFGNVMMEQVQFGMNDILNRMVPEAGMREDVAELFGRFVDTPEAFSVRDGRVYFNAKGVDLEKRAQLRSLFERNPELHRLMQANGIAEEAWSMAQLAGDLQARLGRSAAENEGIIGGFIENYMSRRFDFKHSALRKAGYRSPEEFIRDNLAGDDDLFAPARRLNRNRQGKANFAESRKATEKILVEMERKGLGTLRRDGIAGFTGYVAAMNKAITTNILVRDITQSAPRATQAMFERAGVKLTGKGAARVTGDDGVRMVMGPGAYKRLPADVQQGFEEFVTSARFGWPTPKQEAVELAAATAGAGKLRPFIVRRARDDLAAAVAVNDLPASALREGLTGVADGGLLRVDGTPFSQSDLVDAIRSKGRVPSRGPKGVQGQREINRRIKAHLREREAGILRKQQKRVTKQRKLIGEAAPRKQRIYVHKEIAPVLAEAFRTFGDKKLLSGEAIQVFDRANRALKATVLVADVFHYNVLAFTQALMNPSGFLRAAATPGSKVGISALGGAALGASAEGAAGGDARQVTTAALAGALWGGGLRAASRNALAQRRALMNPRHAETLAFMAHGGFTGQPNDRAIGLVGKWLGDQADRLRREGGSKLLISPLDGTRHVIHGFDQAMWNHLQVGSKQVYFDALWNREIAKLPADLSQSDLHRRKTEIAREVMQGANIALGGLRMSHLLKHPRWGDTARLFQLSPDWTLSNLALSSSVFMNMSMARSAGLGAVVGTAVELSEAGWDPHDINGYGLASGGTIGAVASKWMQFVRRRMATPGDVMAREARRIMGSALLGGYFFANVLNYAFTGHYMWDNEEGQRLSINMGFRDDNGRQVYTKLGKPWEEVFEFGSILEAEKYPIPVFSRTASKMAILPRAGLQILSNKGAFGPIVKPDSTPWELGSSAVAFTLQTVAPIAAQGPGRAAAELSFLGGEGLSGADLARTLIRAPGFSTRTGRARGVTLDSIARFLPPPSLGQSASLP